VDPETESGMNINDSKTPSGGLDWWKVAIGNGPGGYLEKQYNDLFHPGQSDTKSPPAHNFYKDWYPEAIPQPSIPGPEINSEPFSGGGGGSGGAPDYSGLKAGLKEKKPTGHRNDPVYVESAGGASYNPLQQIASGGFSLPNLAGLATTMLAELALGNPLGKLQTGQASSYAWWAPQQQKQVGHSKSNPMYVVDASEGAQNAIDLARNASGDAYQWGGIGPNVYDCSGFMSDLFASTTGRPTGQRYFTTTSDFPALGFQPGFLPGSPLNIGVSPSHTAGTLANGANVESGGAGGMVQYGGSAAGALDPQFTHRYHLPIGAAGLPHLTGAQPGPAMVNQHFGSNAGSGGGFGISGGPLGMAEGAAAMAANAFAPGSGAAVSLAAQEANRFAGYLGQVAATGVEGLMETFSLSGTDLSGRNVDMSKSLPMKIVGGLVGGHPNLPNSAGSPMDTNGPQKKGQTNNTTHNGDVNQTGIRVDNVNVNHQDSEDVWAKIQQQGMSVGGQWLNRSPTLP
jgi:cell wall-associated NlpC family hydrolase